MRFFLTMILATGLLAMAACGPADSVANDGVEKETISVVSDESVKAKFGNRCGIVSTCGDMTYIDCMSAADGPAYYVQGDDMDVMMTCGGACMMGAGEAGSKQCEECPPKEWSCE